MNAHASTPAEAGDGLVVFFDTECGLCQHCVRWLLRIDRRARLRFAPLQGPTAQAWLQGHGLPTEDFESMVLAPGSAQREGGHYLLRTEAVLSALREAGGIGRGVGWGLRLLPAGFRDSLYRGVARCRHAVFGRGKSRALAMMRERWPGRFLA